MTEYHHINIACPRCGSSMEWAAIKEEAPYVVDYHCDGSDGSPGGCAWKGDYNHLTAQYDEYSDEDYVISENTTLQEALGRAIELGCTVEKN
jgi:hypothetical protein